jgi:hypothetical protein
MVVRTEPPSFSQQHSWYGRRGGFLEEAKYGDLFKEEVFGTRRRRYAMPSSNIYMSIGLVQRRPRGSKALPNRVILNLDELERAIRHEFLDDKILDVVVEQSDMQGWSFLQQASFWNRQHIVVVARARRGRRIQYHFHGKKLDSH